MYLHFVHVPYRCIELSSLIYMYYGLIDDSHSTYNLYQLFHSSQSTPVPRHGGLSKKYKRGIVWRINTRFRSRYLPTAYRLSVLVPACRIRILKFVTAKQHHKPITKGNFLPYDSTDHAPLSPILAQSGIVL